MEENIIGMIAEAESKAQARKAQAQLRATIIVSEAERTAADIARSSEEACRARKEEGIRNAESEAEAEYRKSLETAREEGAKLAEALLEHTGEYISEIVGRLTK